MIFNTIPTSLSTGVISELLLNTGQSHYALTPPPLIRCDSLESVDANFASNRITSIVLGGVNHATFLPSQLMYTFPLTDIS